MVTRLVFDKRGFGLIEALVVVVVVALIAAGGYIYYQSNMATDESGLTNQEKAEMQAACKLEIKDELLCAAFTHWGAATADPSTQTITTKDVNGQTAVMTLKSHGENFHSIMGHGDEAMESMQVDNVSYLKMNGVWYKSSVESNQHDAGVDPEISGGDEIDQLVNEAEEGSVEYKNLGKDRCGDLECVKFELINSSDADTTSYFWVDPKKQRIMKMQSSSSDGSYMEMVYVYGPVDIVAPAGAKDYSEMYAM